MTKIILVYELLEQNVPKSRIAKWLGISRRTVVRWSQTFQEHGGPDSFIEDYQQVKKGKRKKRKTKVGLKHRIWALRQKHHDWCAKRSNTF